MRIQEKRLHIDPIHWAIEENMSNASPLSRIEQRDNNNTIVWLDINEIKKFIPKEQESTSKLIIKTVLQIKEGNYLSPAKIYVYDDRILFEDGLHRISAAIKTHNIFVPVIVAKNQIKELKEIMKIHYKEPLLEKPPIL